MPADAMVYAEVNVRPGGHVAEGALAAAGKVLNTSDPAGRLRRLFDAQLKRDFRGASWNRDFAPWVGEKVGIWATGLDQAAPSVAAIVTTTEDEAAASALARLGRAARHHYTRHSLAGIAYSDDKNGLSVAQLDGFVVVGTGEAFERTLTARDGDHLSHVQRYQDAVRDLPRDALGTYFVDTGRLVSSLEQDDAQLRQYDLLLGLRRMGPVAGALTADGARVTLDTVISHLADTPLRAAAATWWRGAAGSIPEAPADAWAAFTLPRLGPAAAGVRASFSRTLTGAVYATESRQTYGLDPQRDVLGWVGDVGGFIRDRSDGALVLHATDPASADAAIRKLSAALRARSKRGRTVRIGGANAAITLDGGWFLARRGDRVVVASSRPAAIDALAPRAALGHDPRYAQALAGLGDGMRPMLVASKSRRLPSELKPYLSKMGVVTFGGKTERHAVRLRLAATFHE